MALPAVALRVAKPIVQKTAKLAGANKPKKSRKFRQVLASELEQAGKGGKEFVQGELEKFIERQKSENEKGEGVETDGAKMAPSTDGNPLTESSEKIQEELNTEKLKEKLGVHENFAGAKPDIENNVKLPFLDKMKNLPVRTSGVAFLLFIIIVILFTLQKTETGETRFSLILKTFLNKTTLRDAPKTVSGGNAVTVTGNTIADVGLAVYDKADSALTPLADGIVGVGETIGVGIGNFVEPFTDGVANFIKSR